MRSNREDESCPSGRRKQADSPEPPPPPRSHTPYPAGNNKQGAESRTRDQPWRSHHHIRAGGIEQRQELIQHQTNRRASFRVVHRRKDPRRDAGLYLLQAHCAVNNQRDADNFNRKRHVKRRAVIKVPISARKGKNALGRKPIVAFRGTSRKGFQPVESNILPIVSAALPATWKPWD